MSIGALLGEILSLSLEKIVPRLLVLWICKLGGFVASEE